MIGSLSYIFYHQDQENRSIISGIMSHVFSLNSIQVAQGQSAVYSIKLKSSIFPFRMVLIICAVMEQTISSHSLRECIFTYNIRKMSGTILNMKRK